MKVILSSTAKSSLKEIIEFLKVKWTEKEIAVMKNDIKKFKQIMKDGIIKHPTVDGFPNLKYSLIGNNQVKIYYSIEDGEVLIRLFWHCKKDPIKMKELLK